MSHPHRTFPADSRAPQVWNRRRWLAMTAVLSVLSGPAAADDGMVVFRGAAEVNVVNVEVVVTDAEGAPVTGLTAADFEIRENGRPVEVSNVYAVENGLTVTVVEAPEGAAASGPAPAPAVPGPPGQPHYLVLYVDNGNLTPAHRGTVLARLRDFLGASWRPELRVMVASNEGIAAGGRARVRQGFTPRAEDVFAALDELEGEPAAGPRFDLDQQNLMRDIEAVNVEAATRIFGSKHASDQRELFQSEARAFLPQIRTFSAQRLQDVRRTLAVLAQFVDSAAGLPGRKSLLYVSDGLPLKPGQALFEAYARRFEVIEDIAARSSPLMEADRFDATADFEALVARANAGRVTFYTLDAAPPGALARGSAATAASAGGNMGHWNLSVEGTRERLREESLRLMADGTGGRHGLTYPSFEATLEGILSDFDNHYSLGYVAERLEGGKKRAIEVKVRRPGVEVRHRSSLRDKTLAERAAERARALLLLDEPQRAAIDDNALAASLATGEQQQRDDGTFVVRVLLTLPVDRVVLLPAEKSHVGRVSMFVAVRDEQGRTSQVNRHFCPVSIPTSEIVDARGATVGCGLRLLMRDGPQRIAVAVLDEVSTLSSTVAVDVDVGTAAAVAAHRLSRPAPPTDAAAAGGGR